MTVPWTKKTLIANRFEVERPAGSGGMCAVYKARDRRSGGYVALKLLHDQAASAAEVERFSREASVLSNLHHPGIVAYVAHGHTDDGQSFLAMQWLEGQDLAERLLDGPLPLAESLRLVRRVAEALVVAHQHGIIHRGRSPASEIAL